MVFSVFLFFSLQKINRKKKKKSISHFWTQFNFKPHNHELFNPRKWWSQREFILSSQSWRIILLCAILLDTLWQIFNFHLFSNQKESFPWHWYWSEKLSRKTYNQQRLSVWYLNYHSLYLVLKIKMEDNLLIYYHIQDHVY